MHVWRVQILFYFYICIYVYIITRLYSKNAEIGRVFDSERSEVYRFYLDVFILTARIFVLLDELLYRANNMLIVVKVFFLFLSIAFFTIVILFRTRY